MKLNSRKNNVMVVRNGEEGVSWKIGGEVVEEREE